MPAPACRVVALAVLLLGGPVAGIRAGETGCEPEVRIERPLPDAVRILLTDPCRAGRFVTFRHNGEEVTRLADGEGRVRLLRFLGRGPDRIELAEADGGWRLLFAEAEETAAAPAEPAPAVGVARAAPVGEPAGERTAAAPTPAVTVPPAEPVAAGGAAGAEAEAEAAGEAPSGAPRQAAGAGPEETQRAAAQEEIAVAAREREPSPAPPPAAVAEGAEKPVPWAMHIDESCRPQVTQEELAPGLVRYRLAAPCAAGRVVRVDHRERDWRLYVELDADGRGELSLPLVDEVSTLDFVVENGGIATVRQEVPEITGLVRVVLVWEDPVDLDLVVAEPGGRAGGRGAVVGDPAGGSGRGVIERRDDGRSVGYKLESYRAPLAAFVAGSPLSLHVVDADRGRVPAPPHCGDGDRAAPAFRIVARVGPEVEERRYRVPAAPCGVRLGERAFYLPAGSLRVPETLVLFPR
jgi:hypothetical protein